jgi:predicted PurR-regulated permease PerM
VPDLRLTQLYRRSFIAALGVLSAVLLVAALYAIRNIAMMFAVAGLLAYLLAGPIDWLSARFGRRRLFTVLVFIVFVILLLGLFGSFIPIVGGQIADLIKNAPEIVEQLEGRYIDLNKRYGFAEPDTRLSDYLTQLTSQLQENNSETFAKVWGYGRTVLGGAASALTWMFLIPLMTLYLLLDSHRLRRALVMLFAERHQANVDQALTAVNKTLGSYIYSRVVLAGFVWLTYTILLTAFGVPYALLLGILAFIGEFIPVVGNLIAFVPIALLVLVTVPDRFIWIVLIIVVIQGLQNYVVQPKVMSDAMDIHPLTVVLVMLVGGTLAGGMGLLLAVPVAAAIKAITSVLVQRREDLLGVNLGIVDLVRRQNDNDPYNDPNLA